MQCQIFWLHSEWDNWVPETDGITLSCPGLLLPLCLHAHNTILQLTTHQKIDVHVSWCVCVCVATEALNRLSHQRVMELDRPHDHWTSTHTDPRATHGQPSATIHGHEAMPVYRHQQQLPTSHLSQPAHPALAVVRPTVSHYETTSTLHQTPSSLTHKTTLLWPKRHDDVTRHVIEQVLVVDISPSSIKEYRSIDSQPCAQISLFFDWSATDLEWIFTNSTERIEYVTSAVV